MAGRTNLTRRLGAAVALVALLTALVAPSTTLAVDPIDLGDIGGKVTRLDAEPVHIASGSGQWQYTFDLTGKASALRVSVDLAQRDTCFRFELRDPFGGPVEPLWIDWPEICSPIDGGQVFDMEVTALRPAQGTWTINAWADGVTDQTFRFRVLAEGREKQPRELLPNLVPWAPFEFGFVAPGSDNPGTDNDSQNQPGDPTVSCHPEEEPTASDCLRFSAGMYNLGAGPLVVVFDNDQAFQLAIRKDRTAGFHVDNVENGDYTISSAGTGEWHEFHLHRHVGDFVQYDLYAVEDAETGDLTAVSTGDKHGYCTFSQQLNTWDAGGQDHQYASFLGSGEFCNDFMTLERGWGDIYRWQRPGQYVSYATIEEPDGTMPAGLYVLRFTVDPRNRIRETVESDNVGYTLIEVVDGGGPGLDSVIECETGLGSGPWDENKVVIDDRFEWAKVAADPEYVAPTCD